MKLYVNEKLFSIRSIFYVKDENDLDVYQISSKAFSFVAKTTINDIKGNKVAYIEQEFGFMPKYKVYINDKFCCKITKKFQLFKNDYLLSNKYRVEGNFMMLDFAVYDEHNNQVGSIKRKFLSLGDKYEIEILDTSKKEIILAIVVAIANDINRSQQRHNSN